MARLVKVKYRSGVLEPLEPLSLEEGTELTVVIPDAGEGSESADTIASTAGAWADLLDCEQFEQEVYAHRLVDTRAETRL
ncbi:MAG: antitoxin family protein [Armatimonadetes bacterium]|nr:antitoxin family protein [Armatimonadota bacterium]